MRPLTTIIGGALCVLALSYLMVTTVNNLYPNGEFCFDKSCESAVRAYNCRAVGGPGCGDMMQGRK